MYKPGSVLDYLNKDVKKEFEDSGISSLFKEESELSQIFHRTKVLEVHNEEANSRINLNVRSGKGDSDVEVEKKRKKLSNAGRRIDGKKHKGLLRLRDEPNLRTAFVGNVSLDTKKKDLSVLFKTFGKIESIRFRSLPIGNTKLPKKAVAIKKAFHPKGNTMNAYIVFQEPHMMQDALSLNNYELNGVHLRVNAASRDVCHDRSIFLGNLPFSCDEESIRRLFEECGEVEGVRVVRDKKTSVGKGIAYVAFKEESSVALALQMNGCEFKKRKLRIEMSSNKPTVKVGKTTSQKKDGAGIGKKGIEKGGGRSRGMLNGKKKGGVNKREDKMKSRSEVNTLRKKKLKGDSKDVKSKSPRLNAKRKAEEISGSNKKRTKIVLKKKINFLEKKNERVDKKKKLKKVIKQKINKNKKAKLGELLSKK